MATTPDWISAGASIALVVVAVVGFAVTVLTIIAARNRQRIEVEGYIRVDVGPPNGTADYVPPSDIVYIESSHLDVFSSGDDDPVISVWYRNLQTHSLGVALGVISRIVIELIDTKDRYQEFEQIHEIAYVEPGKTVRVDAVRFPKDWDCACRIEAIQYRNLDWDGSTPRHGRRECYYIDAQFEMVPWSDPKSFWRERLSNAWRAILTIGGRGPVI